MHTGAADLYSAGNISVDGRYFVDEFQRTLLLRGINLSGNSKLPTRPNGFTHNGQDFFKHHHVSFVGRPFPLEDAHIHFNRLKAWGLTFVRFLITWESIEHAGPGIYDDEYIEYLRQLIQLMPNYGIRCFIDAHQDTWSRFSGGSGAPGWTFEVVGLDITKFKTTGAAYVHNTNNNPQDPLPMLWPTNYTKLATSTMFTLFWAGDILTPKLLYKGKNVKDFLQDHFIGAFVYLATKFRDLPAILGYEVMNEPHPGFIGLKDLHAFDQRINLHLGDSPSALQSFALAAGYPQYVPHFTKSWPLPTIEASKRLINKERLCAWIDNECIWRKHGVWDWDNSKQKPILLRPNYFYRNPKTRKLIDFYQSFYIPFVRHFADQIKLINSKFLTFVEQIPNEISPKWTADNSDLIFSPHWYDLNAVFKKSFNGLITHDVQALQKGKNVFISTFFGESGARKNYLGQISNIVNGGYQQFGERPIILGEFGLPIDINNQIAFKTGDFSLQSIYFDAVISAIESNNIGFTIWNYNPLNNDQFGDSWNFENFSLYNAGKTELDVPFASPDPYEGGRFLDAILRPYAVKIAGIPLTTNYNRTTKFFKFTFKNDFKRNLKSNITEIFLPSYHYKNAIESGNLLVSVSDGHWKIDQETETLYFTHENFQHGFIHFIQISIVNHEKHDKQSSNSFGHISIILFFLILSSIWMILV